MTAWLRSRGWREVPSDAWADAVAAFPEAWLWHSLEYQEAVGSWFNRENVGIAVLDGDQVVAVLPIQLVRLTRSRVLRYRQLHSQGGLAMAAPGPGPDEREAVVANAARSLLRLASDCRASEVVFSSTPVAPWRQGVLAPGNPDVALGMAPVAGLSWVSDVRRTPEEL